MQNGEDWIYPAEGFNGRGHRRRHEGSLSLTCNPGSRSCIRIHTHGKGPPRYGTPSRTLWCGIAAAVAPQ
jgi:hypothetical protein